ncbi:hypothetical protein QEL91_002011 [Pseudomonas putida]|nr:hypothetical protein [Pseudomonas putida]
MISSFIIVFVDFGGFGPAARALALLLDTDLVQKVPVLWEVSDESQNRKLIVSIGKVVKNDRVRAT